MSIETKLPPIRMDAPLPKEYWPKLDHIVTEDDQPLDSIYAERQQRLLTDALYASWHPGEPFVAMANVGLFYQINEPPLVPDVLCARGVSPPSNPFPKENRSYFVWMYGKPPEVVVEHVSNREGGEDTRKPPLYAARGVPYYVIWDPEELLSDQKLRISVLREGVYQPLGACMLKRLGLGLVVWHGVYQGVEADWLRWCDEQGNLLPTGEELARAAQQQAEIAEQRAQTAEQRAETAEQRADRLAAKLRELGVDPNGGA